MQTVRIKIQSCPSCTKTLSSSQNTWLKCQACGFLTKQNADMTRHKQDAHGHPRRGDKSSGSKKISHITVVISDDTLETARPGRKYRRPQPYSKRAVKVEQPSDAELSLASCSSPSTSTPSSFFASSSISSPSTSTSMTSPSSPCAPQSSGLCDWWPQPPQIPVDLSSIFQHAILPDFQPILSANPTGIDALFGVPQIPCGKTTYYEPLGLIDQLASIPDVGRFSPQPTERPLDDFTYTQITPFIPELQHSDSIASLEYTKRLSTPVCGLAASSMTDWHAPVDGWYTSPVNGQSQQSNDLYLPDSEQHSVDKLWKNLSPTQQLDLVDAFGQYIPATPTPFPFLSNEQDQFSCNFRGIAPEWTDMPLSELPPNAFLAQNFSGQFFCI